MKEQHILFSHLAENSETLAQVLEYRGVRVFAFIYYERSHPIHCLFFSASKKTGIRAIESVGGFTPSITDMIKRTIDAIEDSTLDNLP
jgi:hypothetical protein